MKKLDKPAKTRYSVTKLAVRPAQTRSWRTNRMHEEAILIGDAEVARILSISKSWVRGQRFKRRHKLAHEFDLDPIMVGSAPRYRAAEVVAWIERIEAR